MPRYVISHPSHGILLVLPLTSRSIFRFMGPATYPGVPFPPTMQANNLIQRTTVGCRQLSSIGFPLSHANLCKGTYPSLNSTLYTKLLCHCWSFSIVFPIQTASNHLVLVYCYLGCVTPLPSAEKSKNNQLSPFRPIH